MIHTLSPNLERNKQLIQNLFGHSDDIQYDYFQINTVYAKPKLIMSVMVSGLADKDQILPSVITPLLQHTFVLTTSTINEAQNQITIKNTTRFHSIEPCLSLLLQGGVALFFDGEEECLVIIAPALPERSIEEPGFEMSVRGSHEGFVESIGTNMALIRKRIKDPRLRFHPYEFGSITHTKLIIAYIEGLTAPEILHYVKQKLQEIQLDSITSSGEIEQIIEDNPWSIFATIGNTEKPDRAAALLTEGRIVVLVDGDPTSLYGPHLFIESFQGVEDYGSRPYYATLLRILRFLSLPVSVLTPSLYISATNFHKEMIPTALIPSFQGFNEKAPFPVSFEVFIMLIGFELVREAGIRLPKTVGAAVSIVGALILGQVSVDAGLMTPPAIIVVATSIISGFLLTSIADVVSILRLFYLVSASVFGLFGVIMVTLVTITHVVALTSFGVSFMAPLAPLYFSDWKDTIIRMPIRFFSKRPHSIPVQQQTRIKKLPKRIGRS